MNLQQQLYLDFPHIFTYRILELKYFQRYDGLNSHNKNVTLFFKTSVIIQPDILNKMSHEKFLNYFKLYLVGKYALTTFEIRTY